MQAWQTFERKFIIKVITQVMSQTEDSHGVLTGYSWGTHGVLMAMGCSWPWGTHGVLMR